MSFVNLLQWFALFVLGAGVVGLWVRALRPAKDDPRLSKGLQILQSKISILEDLSDRTEAQVKQLTHLIEKKTVDLKQAVSLADESYLMLQQALQKSKEMIRTLQAELTQESVIERKNISKYIQAAQMAHQGRTTMEISQKLGLSPAEVDFVMKVNKNQFVFSEENLPAWIESSADSANASAGVSPLASSASVGSVAPAFDNQATFVQKLADNGVKPYEFKKIEL